VSKASALKVLNPILAVLMLAQAVTGLAHGPLQELSYDIWKATHGTVGLLLVLCVILHVVLNWTWVKSVLLRKKTPRG
jgi:hypothetical protein